MRNNKKTVIARRLGDPAPSWRAPSATERTDPSFGGKGRSNLRLGTGCAISNQRLLQSRHGFASWSLAMTFALVIFYNPFNLFAAKQKTDTVKENYFQAPAGEEAVTPAEANAGVPEAVDIPKIPKLPQVPKVPKVPAPVTRENVQEIPDVREIQKQIQEIISLNASLKTRYHDQVAEIQRISEQAKIHQRILKDYEKARKNAQAPYRTTDAKEILAQEKLRLIAAETQKNRQFIQKLEKKDPALSARDMADPSSGGQ